MNGKTKKAVQETQAELIGILTAISIVAKRLAKNLVKLEESTNVGAQTNAR